MCAATPRDYDRWAQMGNPGWSYAEVLPYFRKSEGHAERRDDFHGEDGPLSVCRARGRNPLFDRFVEAGVQAGYPRNDDFNGADQDGFGRYDFTIRNGKRCSTSRSFPPPGDAAAEPHRRHPCTDASGSSSRDGRAVAVDYVAWRHARIARTRRARSCSRPAPSTRRRS